MVRVRRTAAVEVWVVLALLAGCGGSGASEKTSAEAAATTEGGQENEVVASATVEGEPILNDRGQVLAYERRVQDAVTEYGVTLADGTRPAIDDLPDIALGWVVQICPTCRGAVEGPMDARDWSVTATQTCRYVVEGTGIWADLPPEEEVLIEVSSSDGEHTFYVRFLGSTSENDRQLQYKGRSGAAVWKTQDRISAEQEIADSAVDAIDDMSSNTVTCSEVEPSS